MKVWIIICGFCLGLLAVSSSWAGTEAQSAPAAQFTEIKGSQESLARLHKMLEQLGGQALWAEARSLYLVQRTRSPKIGDGILSMSWRDLESPAEWGELQHDKLKVRYAWSEEGGWFRKDGKYRDYIADEIAEKVFYWQRDLYTLIHRLAKDDVTYHLEVMEPYGILVRSADFEKTAEFHLTQTGELYRWQLLGGKKDYSSIYGPYKSFGQVRFPDWMTSMDGQWGAYQIQVMPSPIPFNEQVSLRKPIREWQGGAVKKNCEQP